MIIELLAEYWVFALALLATGFIAGILAGLLGVGGGIVIVPVLYYIFNLLELPQHSIMHVAVGTSLATIIPTSIRSLAAHASKGAVDWGILKSWALGLFVGVLIGTILAKYFDGRALMVVFGTVAILISFHMAFGREHWRLGSSLPGGSKAGALSAGVGALSTMMGIGGGTLGVPIMILYGSTPQRAVATASGFGLIISIPAAIGFLWAGQTSSGLPPGSFGYVNLIGFALITPMTILTAPIGVRIAHTLPKKRLKQAFAFFLFLTALRMISSVA